MDKKKSAAAGKSGGAEKTNQTSAPSKSEGTHGCANVRMVQNVLLIWLDNNIDENNADCQNTIKQLRRVVNTVNTFADGDQCVEFIENMENEKACMIISGALGQHMVPRVHNMSQVDSIFIFCGNKKRHEQWAKEWAKIKGVFTEIAPICEALKKVAQQCEQNAIAVSFVATSGEASNKNLDQLDSLFMYTQILKEILLKIEFNQKHIKEFVDYCRDIFANNEYELKNVDKFARKYHDETPIWWYTCESFVYPTLNRALKLMDLDVIIKMGFFVCDLHRHIEKLHSEQFDGHHSNKTFTVYRGQGVSKADFEKMKKTKGGLTSFNTFLSTSKDRSISLSFARQAVNNPDLVGILFVMTIDPSKSTVPFASTAGVSYYEGADDEVLFSMHTVFRICDIKPMNENDRLFQIDLILTSDNDKDLHILTDRMREEIFQESNGWHRLSLLLLKMGQLEKAQQVYEVILGQTSDEGEKGSIYHQIGLVKYDQGEYKEACTFYEKALEIRRKTLPPNHPNLASSYNNIGLVCSAMGEHSKALSYYEKTLEIRQKILPPNHPDLASSYNNVGSVYSKMGQYSKALSYYEKVLEIQQKTLPPNHPDLGTSYNNIGMVYGEMAEYSKAISSYQHAVDIAQRSLPANHPNLEKFRKNFEDAKKKL